MQIGCDLVLISRIEKLIESPGFLNKVFHEEEILYCKKQNSPAPSFAARFAAKEAFSKALGTGIFAQGVVPKDIWVINDANGKPLLFISEAVRSVAAARGIVSWDISLSHQGDYAMAVAILF